MAFASLCVSSKIIKLGSVQFFIIKYYGIAVMQLISETAQKHKEPHIWQTNKTQRKDAISITNWLINSTEQSTSWEANRSAAAQEIHKFPAFYGNRGLITAFTRAHHLSLSSTRSIQSMLPHPTSLRSILILSSHLRLGFASGLVPSDLPAKILYASLLSPIRATCSAYLSLCDLIIRIIFDEYRR